MTALLRLSLFPVLVSDSAGVCHFQAFSPSFHTWEFITSSRQCSFFIFPASHHHLPLSAQFFGLFSAIHIHPSASMLTTQLISVVSIFCSACGSASQARGMIPSCGCSSSLRSVLSMLPPACSAASHHQSSHYWSLYCSRTSSHRIVLAFPLLFHETEITTSRLFASLALVRITALIYTDCAVTPL